MDSRSFRDCFASCLRSYSTLFMFTGNDDNRDQFGWEFYVDTDFAGNSEKQNKCRSQVGILATLNTVPVYSLKIGLFTQSE